MNLFLQLCNLILFVFWKKLKTPKWYFENIWPLCTKKILELKKMKPKCSVLYQLSTKNVLHEITYLTEFLIALWLNCQMSVSTYINVMMVWYQDSSNTKKKFCHAYLEKRNKRLMVKSSTRGYLQRFDTMGLNFFCSSNLIFFLKDYLWSPPI
mgnify:CR=1 FL=1